MPRTIDEFIAELPSNQQEEIERRYQALRRTMPPPPQHDKAKDVPPVVPSMKRRRS